MISAGPHDAVYQVRTDLDGRPTVVFGDGERGRRLPAGTENVVATYRAGAGAGGNAAAGSLKIARTLPRGVRAVTNPEAAYGGTDGERPDELRVATPRHTELVDRVVSLRDHETFARSFGGVAKARARSFWNGARRVLHLTATGSAGAPLPDDVKRSLRAALTRASAARNDLVIGDCERRGVRVHASVRVAGDRPWPAVRDAVTAALREGLSALRRDVAQPVWASEVIALMQAVPGVASVRLTALFLAMGRPGDVPTDRDMTTPRLNDVLPAPEVRQVIREGRLVLEPARLLVIDDDPTGIALTLDDQEPRR